MTNNQAYTATIGFFDGVHLGHRYLIERLKEEARTHMQKSMVITFKEHPRKVLKATYQPRLLNTFEEKMSLLTSTGIDQCVALHFDKQLAQMSAQTFISDILHKELDVKTLIIGYDNRFGNNLYENFEQYQSYGNHFGIKVIQLNDYKRNNIDHISSTVIRHILEQGEIRAAAKLLSYNYRLSGKVIEGVKIGRTIGFPTANLSPYDDDKLIPAVGVYAVYVHIQEFKYKGMMNIGMRPTFKDGTDISLEVNILDFNQDIYNQDITIEFIDRIRNEIKFKSAESLVNQLNMDKETTMNIFKNLE